MAKTAKKTAKLADKNAPKHRTIEDRLDAIELGVLAMLWILSMADVSMKEVPAKTAKKAKK